MCNKCCNDGCKKCNGEGNLTELRSLVGDVAPAPSAAHNSNLKKLAALVAFIGQEGAAEEDKEDA